LAADGSHLDRLSGGESILGLKLVRTEARSTVWRCTSSQGVLWFKENSSTNPAEGAIHHVLAGLAPEYVTPPVAWDRSRGWILTRDGGTTMMDRKPETRGIDPSGVSELCVTTPSCSAPPLTIGRRCWMPDYLSLHQLAWA